MLSSEVIFNTDEVKECIALLDNEKVDKEIYFDNLKQKKINEFADKTNEDFNRLIDQICENIETSNNIYMLKRISTALNKLNAISKRLYYSEVEFLDFL